MNILLRKEIRLLLPALVTTLVMSAVPAVMTRAAWVARNGWLAGSVALACFTLGILFLALSPFGQEINFGTFGQMLAQPRSRRRVWWTKMGALAAAMAASIVALCLTWQFRGKGTVIVSNMPLTSVMTESGRLAGFATLLALVVVSSGLWTTLVFRQVTTAFWCSLLIPGSLLALVETITRDTPKMLPPGVFRVVEMYPGARAVARHIIQTIPAEIMAMGAYALVGFLLAGWLFFRAEDVPSSRVPFSAPVSRGGARWLLASVFRKKRGVWAALLYKELQLQQITVWMALGLAVIYGGAMASMMFGKAGATTYFFVTGVVFWTPWLLFPIVIGAAAVAEERRMNALEGQHCLPVRKRTIFGMKFAVVLFLGVLFGAVLPSMLSSLGQRAGVSAPVMMLSGFAALSVVLAAVSFYASTLARSTMQALGTALVLLVLAGAAGSLMTIHPVPTPWNQTNPFTREFTGNTWEQMAYIYAQLRMFLEMDLHVGFLAWPVALATFFWLCYGNYRRLQMTQRVWLFNLGVWSAVAGATLLVSNVIHARLWNAFTRLEPAHGPARLGESGDKRVKMVVMPFGVPYILLPDGRVWAPSHLTSDGNTFHAQGKFVDSSNWIDLAATTDGAVGIRSDHTLWAIDAAAKVTRIGAAADWRAVGYGDDCVLGIKEDGTLWQSRPPIIFSRTGPRGNVRETRQPNPDPEPVVSLGENWRAFLGCGQVAFGVASNGSIFQIGANMAGRSPDGRFVRRVLQNPDGTFGYCHFSGTNWSSIVDFAMGSPALAVSGEDELWLDARSSAPAPEYLFGRKCPSGVLDPPVRLGDGPEWREVAGYFGLGPSVAGVEKNGTLWLQWMPWTQFADGSPYAERPSAYSDWVAVTPGPGGFIALAADGTLCLWTPQYHSILGLPEPRRRPALSLNIFDTL